MEFDTRKETSVKIPYYKVNRNDGGIVVGCIKNADYKCQCCIFIKYCKCKDEN